MAVVDQTGLKPKRNLFRKKNCLKFRHYGILPVGPLLFLASEEPFSDRPPLHVFVRAAWPEM